MLNSSTKNNCFDLGRIVQIGLHDFYVLFFKVFNVNTLLPRPNNPQTGDFINIIYVQSGVEWSSVPGKIIEIIGKKISFVDLFNKQVYQVSYAPLGTTFGYGVGTHSGKMLDSPIVEIPQGVKLILSFFHPDYSKKYEGHEIDELFEGYISRDGKLRGAVIAEFPDGRLTPLNFMDIIRNPNLQFNIISVEKKFIYDTMNHQLKESYLPQYPPGTKLKFYKTFSPYEKI